MQPRKRYLAFLLPVLFSSCGYQTATFTSSADYTSSDKLKDVYVIVVSDKNTNTAMNYYRLNLVDSLKSYGVAANGSFFCCRNEETVMNDVMKQMLPTDKFYKHILVIAITKTAVGYGTSSAREFELALFNNDNRAKAWSGSLKSTFDWFISDDNYRAVATKLTTATLAELKKKGIL